MPCHTGPARAPAIEWIENPTEILGQFYHESISVFTDVLKTDFDVGSGVIIYGNGVIVLEIFFQLQLYATVF